MNIFLLLAVMVGGVVAFFFCANWWTGRHPRRLGKDAVIKMLENFLDGNGGPYDWDDFLTLPIADPDLEAVRRRCNDIDWKTDVGTATLRKELERLKDSAR
jgi:hypothetical protein